MVGADRFERFRAPACASQSVGCGFRVPRRLNLTQKSSLRLHKYPSEIRRRGDGLPGADSSDYKGWPEITLASFTNIFVDNETLNVFLLDRVHRLRSRDLFAGPQIIVHKSPRADTGRIGVAISDEGTIFNATFYGFSPGTHPDATLLVR